MLRGLGNFEKSKKCWTQQDKYSRVSLNEWKLYFSKLLKEYRTEFLNGGTEREDDKNTDNIHLDTEIVDIAIASLKNGTAYGEEKYKQKSLHTSM